MREPQDSMRMRQRDETNGLVLRLWKEIVLMWMLTSERRKDLREGKETVKEEGQDSGQW